MDDLPVGGRVWFAEEKRPYTVQARSRRFLVCNKPFAARRTVLYCIIDLKTRMRAPEDLVFGFGAETTAQCEAMVRRLEKDESGLSRRREAPLMVVRVEHPATPNPGAASVVLAVDKRNEAQRSAAPSRFIPPTNPDR